MPSDPAADQAREHHRAASAAQEDAARHRHARDGIIRHLRSKDPSQWTYTALAGEVGCTPQLIRWIVKGDRSRKR